MIATQPLLFDLDEMARVERVAAPWTGAPLGFTTDYYSPDELRAALDRYIDEHGRSDCYGRSHMWKAAIASAVTTARGHECHLFSACARCDYPDHDHSADPLPGTGLDQVICPPCRWHYIAQDENEAVEAWHDHAMPGWRELPLFTRRTLGGSRDAKSRAWVEEHYPAEWQFPGVPILTLRQPGGTRHVDHYSPLGGYDLCVGEDGNGHF